jgi:GT2 family glycosyltransferase
LVCYTEPADFCATETNTHVEFIRAPAGLARQRNRILDTAEDCDIVLFVDDDFLAMPNYIAATLEVLARWPSIVATTGRVIADGINGPGLTVAQAQAIMATDRGSPFPGAFVLVRHGYGCNMAIRRSVAHAHHLRFDENLPLYGWYEDIDFTRRLGRYGDIVRLDGARGVHLGVKLGRTSGRKLGYSQIANPIYLARKGTYPWRQALGSMGRNAAANIFRSIWPEPYIDRAGRLAGNLAAVLDLGRGRLQPKRILEL